LVIAAGAIMKTPSAPKSHRSPIGWFWLIAFVAFNVVIIGLLAHLNLPDIKVGEEVMGRGYGTLLLGVIWLVGAPILGLAAFLTRAKA
jgi:hypothetical protein